jgi:hypothetical protein
VAREGTDQNSQKDAWIKTWSQLAIVPRGPWLNYVPNLSEALNHIPR